MKYKLILSHRFDRDFSRLERPIQDRVVEGLRELSQNPYKGKPLKGKLKGMWSFRTGKYRIVYQIQDEKLIVFVIDVEHRKHVYEK